ncbi:MAG: hypothetical protein HC831_04420 [Chloroflexia bacterium]|nr:hypothetical protein [Chloroflexia bacterium]
MKVLKLSIVFCAAFLCILTSSCKKEDSLLISESDELAASSLKSVPNSGTITAQYYDSPGGEDIAKAIDGNVNTKYLTFHNSVWLQWQGNTALVLTKYAITSANDFATRDPKSWTLYGSNDGNSWTALDVRANQTFSARFQKKEYLLNANLAYTYFKLDITANNGASITQLAEWDLDGSVPQYVATVYQHCPYGGYAVQLSEGSYSLTDLEARVVINNDLSSLKVQSGYRVILYDGDNFTGNYVIKTSDSQCLTDDGFNDKTTSIKVEKAGPTENIDDLMPLAHGFTYTESTPMGQHYAGLHVTTDSDRAWLSNPGTLPTIPSALATSLHWANFSVTLYPYGNPSPADINQHNIGDCGGIAAMASMAYLAPNFVKTLINDNGNGTYAVAMFDPQGKPVTVVVDSRFLADSNGNLGEVSGKGGIAVWSTILEKAIMKYNEIYHANTTIEGIGSEHTIPLFTGNGSSFAFDRNILTPDELARVARVCLAEGKFIIGGFGQVLPVGNVNTVTAHAYTIMISGAPTALFAMRNPWGVNPLVSGGYETTTDGVLDIPATGSVPSIIDFRIIEPGLAGTAGTTSPYIPPVQSLKSSEQVRISERLIKTGM